MNFPFSITLIAIAPGIEREREQKRKKGGELADSQQIISTRDTYTNIQLFTHCTCRGLALLSFLSCIWALGEGLPSHNRYGIVRNPCRTLSRLDYQLSTESGFLCWYSMAISWLGVPGELSRHWNLDHQFSVLLPAMPDKMTSSPMIAPAPPA